MLRIERKVTCIVCPKGCDIVVTLENGRIVNVRGNSCPMGKEYAVKEITNPERVLMSVVKCVNGDLPVVSVKSSRPVPLKDILKASKALADMVVEAPVNIGDVVVRNLAGLGIDVVATRPCMEVSKHHPATEGINKSS